MIAYEIQLQYVIRDKIQSETKLSPKQNPVREKKILSEKFFLSENKLSKILSWTDSNNCNEAMGDSVVTKLP